MANLPELFRGDRMLGEVFRDMDDFMNRMWMAPLALNRQMRDMISQPRMDIDESNDAYLLTFEVPGFKDEEININIQENSLTVSGEHKQEEGTEGRRSRRYESFTRSLTLPSNVNPDQIEARYENGLLEVFVPKAEEQKPKSVQIQKGSGSFSQKLQGSQSKEGQGANAQSEQQAKKAQQKQSAGPEARH